VDEQGRHHCLLVVGDGRRDGILVNSEGGAYARYSAFVPNAAAWLTAEQYPPIADLNHKLERTLKRAEGLITEAAEDTPSGERLAIGIDRLGAISDIDFGYNQILLDTVAEMIGGLPGVVSAELDDGEFIIYRDTDVLERAADTETLRTVPAIKAKQSDIDAYGYRTADWLANLEQTPGQWREDMRYRQQKDGTMYYLGGESGQYIRLANDGDVTLGRYDRAGSGIENAVLTHDAVFSTGGYEMAVLMAAQLGGTRFLSDLDGLAKYTPPETAPEKPSVMKQIREAKAAPKPPRKDKSQNKHKGDAEL
jgi:hypothetical protein